MPLGNPAGYLTPPAAPPAVQQGQAGAGGVYPAGLAPQPQFPLTSNLYGQQGNTLQTAIAAQNAQMRNRFLLPLQILQMRTQLLENRNRVNQNFSPNRARRAFIGGI